MYKRQVIDIIKDKGLLQESQGTNIVDLEEYNMPPALITKNDEMCIRDRYICIKKF